MTYTLVIKEQEIGYGFTRIQGYAPSIGAARGGAEAVNEKNVKRLPETDLERLWASLSNKLGKKMVFPSERFMRESILSSIDILYPKIDAAGGLEARVKGATREVAA